MDIFELMTKMIQYNAKFEKENCVTLASKKRVCYDVANVYEVLADWTHCYYTVVRGHIPETAEELLYLFLSGVKTVVSSGLYKYYIG